MCLWELYHNFILFPPAFLAYGAFFILSVEMPDLDGDRSDGKIYWLVHGMDSGTRMAFLAVILASLLWLMIIWLGTLPTLLGLAFARLSLSSLSAG